MTTCITNNVYCNTTTLLFLLSDALFILNNNWIIQVTQQLAFQIPVWKAVPRSVSLCEYSVYITGSFSTTHDSKYFLDFEFAKFRCKTWCNIMTEELINTQCNTRECGNFILQMPLLDHTVLTTDKQRRLAHMILTFIGSGYVWQDVSSGAAQVRSS